MEQTPAWEADSHSASQEIPRLILNPKDHYRIHKNPPLVAITGQINVANSFPPYISKIHSNFIFLYTS
jgi:hypothetical protein